MTQGTLFIISAASGTGKTSLVKELLATTENIAVSVSHTTRQIRVGEVHGQHYYFVSTDEFAQMIANGEFLENAEVFGNHYGTSRAAVKELLDQGTDVILEIDWQGALQVKKIFSDAVMIFILPPSKQTLRQRLSARGQDSIEVINTRLAGAVAEMRMYSNFDYVVINDDFDVALQELQAIITASHLATTRQSKRYQLLISELLTDS